MECTCRPLILQLSEQSDILSWMIYTTRSSIGNARIIKTRPPIASSDHFVDWSERSHLLCYMFFLIDYLAFCMPVIDFISMTCFCHRELYANNLSGQVPNELGNLTNLVSLDLYLNNLSGPIPKSLGNLQKLRFLYASFVFYFSH